MDGKIPPSQHSNLPWRINEMANDFELIDAWRLPADGDKTEFGDLCAVFDADRVTDADKNSKASRFLFQVRNSLGQRFGWDENMNTLPIPGCTEVSMRDRLPVDVEAASIDGMDKGGFLPVFQTETEAAFEISNNLLHAILHLGWVDDGDGRYHGQMGIYVNHRQRRSVWYMKSIAPFRRFIVYPSLLRMVKKSWEARNGT